MFVDYDKLSITPLSSMEKKPILWKYFYSLTPMFVVSTNYIDPWVLEFVVSTNYIDPWVLEFVVSTNCIDPRVLEFVVSTNCIDPWVLEFVVSTNCIDPRVLEFVVSTNCIDPRVLEFVVSTDCIDPWVLEFVASNTTGLIIPLVSFGHCVVCSSIYGFWLSLWYLMAIVLSVLLLFTDSVYPFGIFWPLCCLFFFYLRILIIPLVSFGHCVVCSSIYGF
jgi:hypothetical protein